MYANVVACTRLCTCVIIFKPVVLQSYLFFMFLPVELSDDFPQEKPLLILQSIYHRIDGTPCHSIVDNYPYSPRWNADEQAERMRLEKKRMEISNGFFIDVHVTCVSFSSINFVQDLLGGDCTSIHGSV